MKLCNGCKGFVEDGSLSDLCQQCQGRRNARLQAEAATAGWTMKQHMAALVGAATPRRIGTLEKYYGEYGKALESKREFFEWLNGGSGYWSWRKPSAIARMVDEAEELRVEHSCVMFNALLVRLMEKLEATR